MCSLVKYILEQNNYNLTFLLLAQTSLIALFQINWLHPGLVLHLSFFETETITSVLSRALKFISPLLASEP